MKKILLIPFLLVSVAASSQWLGSTLDTLTNNSVSDALNHQCMAINDLGQLHLTFKQANPVSGFNIYYKFRDNQLSWSSEVLITSQKGYNPVIAAGDIQGDAFIAFDGEDTIDNDDEIYFCSNATGSWICDQLTSDTIDDSSPTIAIDEAGHIHLAWVTNDSVDSYKIKYANNITGSWSIQEITNSQLGPFGSGASPEIAVEKSGVAHIAYRGGAFGTYKIHHAFNLTPGDSAWNFDYLVTPNAEDLTPSIQIGTDSSVHLLVCGNDGFGFPMKSYYFNKPVTSATFSTPTAVATSYSATVGDLFVDNTNIPHCVLNEVSGNIYTGNVVYANSNNWNGSSLLSTGTIYEANLVVDVTGHASLVGYIDDAFNDPEIIFYGVDFSTGLNENFAIENPLNIYSRENQISLYVKNNFSGNINCCSIEGKVVFDETKNFNTNQSMEIRNLSKGIYLINIKAGEGSVTSKVVVD